MSNGNLHYLVPRDTASFLRSDVIMSKCQNLGLILARYIPREVVQNESVGKYDKWRERWLKDRCSRFESDKPSQWRDIFQATSTRWDAMTAHTDEYGRFAAQLEGRMVVGLGSESVLETGITLHPVTGLPFIPGSSLKGITRTYGLLTIAAELGVPVLTGDDLLDYLATGGTTPLDVLDDLLALPSDAELEGKTRSEWLNNLNTNKYMQRHERTVALEDIDALPEAAIFRLAFGSQAQAGICTFYEGVLADLPRYQLFELDVMTPHYPDYYSSEGQKAPSDDQGPNPIQFITVARGTVFKFAFGIDGHRFDRFGSDIDPVQFGSTVREWFQQGLQELGAGAKTHAGYGLFRIV